MLQVRLDVSTSSRTVSAEMVQSMRGQLSCSETSENSDHRRANQTLHAGDVEVTKDEIKSLKLDVPEIDPVRLGDDPEKEKAIMFVRGWNSAIDCICGVATSVSREKEQAA